jgi:phosphate acetyltransferase/phosphate butyryltransferase
MNAADEAFIENRPYAELVVGDEASLARMLTNDDIRLFAIVSGDVNPAHLDREYASGTCFQGVIGHGLWTASLVSAVLGTRLPGPGTIYIGQSVKFHRTVKPGDTVTARVKVSAKEAARRRVLLDCTCTNQRGEVVMSGLAEVSAPEKKVRRPRPRLPEVNLD